MKMKWENWMREGEHEFTKSNKVKRASYSEVCNWIGNAGIKSVKM